MCGIETLDLHANLDSKGLQLQKILYKISIHYQRTANSQHNRVGIYSSSKSVIMPQYSVTKILVQLNV